MMYYYYYCTTTGFLLEVSVKYLSGPDNEHCDLATTETATQTQKGDQTAILSLGDIVSVL